MTQTTIPTWSRGERMAKARSEAGLSQIEMAEKLGTALGLDKPLSDKTISTWETEQRQPRQMMRVLEAWADITGVPLWWLLDVATDLGVSQSRWTPIQAGETPAWDDSQLDDLDDAELVGAAA